MSCIGYCENGKSLGEDATYDHGLPRCLFQTVTSLVLFVIVILACLPQLVRIVYRRVLAKQRYMSIHNETADQSIDATASDILLNTENTSSVSAKFLENPAGFIYGENYRTSCLYTCQLFFHVCQFVLPLLDLVVKGSLQPSRIQGVTILADALMFIAWFLAYFEAIVETQQRYIARMSRYSTPLLLFWGLQFIANSLVLISWNNTDWWFHRKTSVESAEFVLFWLRYSFSALILFLGMKAPALYKPNYQVPVDDDELFGTPLASDGAQSSTFKGVWKKLKVLWPFLWPNRRSLQLRVVICFLLLGGGRAVNLFIPLFYRDIVNYLTPGKNGLVGKSNPLHLIFIYITLRFLQGGGTGGIEIETTVTEIWYSILLSKKTYKLLRTSLEELVSFTSAGDLKSKTAGLISIAESSFKQFQDVWKTWLSLQVEGTEWIQKQRKKTIKSGEDFGLEIMSGYVLNIPAEHTVSARKWIDDGVMIRTKAPTFAENPTLTGVDHFDSNPFASFVSYSYCIESRHFPFSCWDYVQVKKFKSCNCLVTMYGGYVECILRNFVNKLSNGQITFNIVLSDCMHIKRHIHGVYDRILTSNLMDYIFLPRLLKICSELLNHDNQHATIVTETMLWAMVISPEGGFSFRDNDLLLPKLIKIAMEDTKRPLFPTDGGASVSEYLDHSCEFFDYLRAIFHASRLQVARENRSTEQKTSSTPVIKELGNELHLRLRDVFRNENRIVFFRPAVNRRRVSCVAPLMRSMEWVPLCKKGSSNDKI